MAIVSLFLTALPFVTAAVPTAINSRGAGSGASANDPCGALAVSKDTANGNVISQQCLHSAVAAGPLRLAHIPDNFSFPPKTVSAKNQDSFSQNQGGQDNIVSVEDLRNGGGFILNISAGPFKGGANVIPADHLFVASGYPNQGGTQIGGVEYDKGSFGPQNIVAPVFGSAPNSTPKNSTAFKSSFAKSPITLMDATNLNGSSGRVGKISQSLNFYLNIPANQPAGSYSITFTLDLIGV